MRPGDKYPGGEAYWLLVNGRRERAEKKISQLKTVGQVRAYIGMGNKYNADDWWFEACIERLHEITDR